MKKRLFMCAAGLLASGALSAGEWGTTYSKLQLSKLDVDINLRNLISEDTTPSAVNFAYGLKVNDYLAVEGNLGLGWQDDKISNSDYDFELDKMYGLAVVGYLPLNEYFRFYGKVGHAKLQFEDSITRDASATGAMFGAGIEISFTENLGAMVEYIEYPDGDYKGAPYQLEIESFAMGVYFRY